MTFVAFGGSGVPGDPAGGPDGSVESGGASDPWILFGYVDHGGFGSPGNFW